MELNGIGSSDRGNNTSMGNIVGNLGATKQSLYFCLQWPNELIRKSEVSKYFFKFFLLKPLVVVLFRS